MLSLRASLIVALVIPLSLAASFIYLYVRGMSANLLSMGAVDFGIIVDGAVILVEHLFHKLSPHHGSTSRTATREPLAERDLRRPRSEVARPTLFSLLIIIAAYLPIFSLAARRGPDLLAAGQHGGQRARRRAARQLHAGAGAVLLRAPQARSRSRDSPLLRLGAARLRPDASPSR